jgi:hypothetical protein
MQQSNQARQSMPGGADGTGTGDDEGEEEVAYPQQEQVRTLLAGHQQQQAQHKPS